MKEKLKAFIEWCNQRGVPVPIFRDPATQTPSVSFSLVVASSFFVAAGLLNSVAQIFKGIDMQSALYWAGMCYALYFGRKVSGDGKTLNIENKP